MELKKLDWTSLGWATLVLMLHLASLRPIVRFVPHGELAGALYMAVALGICWYVLQPARREALVKLLDKPWIFGVGLAILTAVSVVVYPIADGLKTVGRGSDGDDALIVGIHSMLTYATPYHNVTYLGGPLSPGPGWIFLLAPLTLTGLYALLAPLSVGLVAWAARAEGIRWGRITLAMALVFSSLAAWEMTVSGIDHIPNALLFLAVVMRLRKAEKPVEVALMTVLMGMMATSRIVFIYWPILVAFLLVPEQGWRKAFGVGFGATCLTVALHVWGWETAPWHYYHPLHVFMKTKDYDGGSGHLFQIIALVISGVAGLLMLKNWLRWPAYVHLFVGIFVPLFCTGLGELVAHKDVANMNMASYLMLGAPFLVAALLFGNTRVATR